MNLKVLLVGSLSVVSLFAFSDNVAKHAITTAGKVAEAAINKNKVEVKMKDTELNNDVKIKRGASIGNSGIAIKGDKVNLKKVKIKNKVKIEEGVSFGNSGVEVGR